MRDERQEREGRDEHERAPGEGAEPSALDAQTSALEQASALEEPSPRAQAEQPEGHEPATADEGTAAELERTTTEGIGAEGDADEGAADEAGARPNREPAGAAEDDLEPRAQRPERTAAPPRPELPPSEPGPPSAPMSAPPSSLLRPGLALRTTGPLALLAVSAWLFGRGLTTAVRGLAVGIGRIVSGTELVGSILSHLFALVGCATMLSHVIVLVSARLPLFARVASVTLGGFIGWLALSSSLARMPFMVLLGSSAAAIALLALSSSLALRNTLTRPFAWLALGGAVVALVRWVTAALGVYGVEVMSGPAFGASRRLASVSLAAIALLGLGALSVLHLRGRLDRSSDERPALASVPSLVVVALAFAAGRAALMAEHEDASTFVVLVRRLLDSLSARPIPTLPPFARYACLAAVTLAPLGLFALRTAVPAWRAALVLVLVGAGAPDRPLGALALVLGATTILVASIDQHGIWQAMGAAAPRASPPDEPPRSEPPQVRRSAAQGAAREAQSASKSS